MEDGRHARTRYDPRFTWALQFGKTVKGLALNRDESDNSSLRGCFAEYETYLEQCYVYGLHRAAICKIELILSSVEGSAPANSIDVYLKCDKPAKLITKEDWPAAPKRPSAPEQPGVFGITNSSLAVLPFIPIPTMAEVLRDADQTRPRLTTTDRNAKFYLHQIKHRQTCDVLPLSLDSRALKKPATFQFVSRFMLRRSSSR